MEFAEDDLAGKNLSERRPQKSIIPHDFGCDCESVGIPDSNKGDFGRESLGFDLGRESLGIMNLNMIDLGRESLGITSFNFNEMPPILISDVSKNTTNIDELNRGFCLTSKDSEDIPTFASSLNTLFSFSSCDSVPSTISLGLPMDHNIHNNAFKISSNFITMSCLEPALKKNKATRRILSAPANLEEEVAIQQSPKCDTDFAYEAVFMEAQHLVSKIGDGSIYLLGPEEVDYDLDTIQPPANFVDISDSQSDREAFSISEAAKNAIGNISFNPISLPETANSENLSKICNADSSKTKSPMEVLQSLSNILNQNEFTNKQKFEGKLLISSLTELMLSNRDTTSSLNDSGHSSIEEQPLNLVSEEKGYEALDLRKSASIEEYHPLDLSLKSKESDKVFVSPKILPRKFNITQPKNSSVSSKDCSVLSNESTDSGRFKIRKAEQKIGGKGPMKATVLLAHTKKNSGSLAIPKSKNRKTTSTPIREHALPKPVAHSTPDNLSNSINKVKKDSSMLPKHKLDYSPLSSFSRSQNDSKTSINKPELKRRSFNDLRTTAENAKGKLTRSYSMGEQPGTNRMTPTKIHRKTQEIKRNQENVLKENVRLRLSGSVGKKVGKENVKKV